MVWLSLILSVADLAIAVVSHLNQNGTKLVLLCVNICMYSKLVLISLCVCVRTCVSVFLFVRVSLCIIGVYECAYVCSELVLMC